MNGTKKTQKKLCRAIFRGIGIGDGTAYGNIRLISKEESPRVNGSRGREAEEADFNAALSRALAQTRELYKKTLSRAGKDAAEIFEIHEMLLCDPDFTDRVIAGISSGMTASDSVCEAGKRLASVFEGMEDEYLSARAADIRDISERIRRIILGKDSEIPAEGMQSIVVCRDLSPGDTASLDNSRVAGFVTFEGSVNSHTAILARAMDIPALVRAEEFGKEFDGAPAILDASEASLIINPTPEEMLAFAEKNSRAEAERSRLRTLGALPAVTKSGKRVALYANIGSIAEAEAAYRTGAEGIGLFRSEFLFLGREGLPGEGEQFAAYSEVARMFKDREGEVVIRTLDIGADKRLPALGDDSEDNPALGMRGIRLCLSHHEIFRTQLRAILRASAYGKISLMLPMITNIDEIIRTKRILAEEKNKLRYEEIDFDDSIRLGIMIETPASAIMARELAAECDFFSVGTNDLFQYTLAADRQNHALSYLTEGDSGIEPVLRLIRLASDGIHAAGGDKWIGICGELAADTSLTETLLALGADELSVSPPYIARIKDKIRSIE